MLHTTFKLLYDNEACKGRYRHLAKQLGGIKMYGRETPIPLTRVLEINGLPDALWALCAVPEDQRAERDRLARLFACRCVRETSVGDGRTVWDLLTDKRSRRAVVVAEAYATGKGTEEELIAARDAAWAAARAAACAAARDAAWDAARDAARDAAWDAARDAARDAAWDAAWAAAMDAAWDAARDAQSAILREMLNA